MAAVKTWHRKRKGMNYQPGLTSGYTRFPLPFHESVLRLYPLTGTFFLFGARAREWFYLLHPFPGAAQFKSSKLSRPPSGKD